MCRAGGRRCEHNWSEAQHQADLARRRAIYALQKAGVQNQRTENVITVSEGGQPTGTTPLVMTPENPPACITGMTTQRQDCNLTYKVRVKDEVTEHEFAAYHPEAIAGQIQPKKLNTESYKEFGFEDPGRWEEGVSSVHPMQKAEAMSKAELSQLSPHEQAALALFTTDDYSSINEYLHESSTAQRLKAEETATQWHETIYGDNLENNLAESITEDALPEQQEKQHYTCVREYAEDMRLRDRLTTSTLSSYVDTADEAFSKASGKQRVVYRGERFNSDSERFKGYKTMASYAKAKYKVGNQINFKGMQSTSTRPQTAQSFADAGGIMYEISTPSGIALSAVSSFSNECEVLLPRNSTYMVVGQKQFKQYGSTFTVVQLVEVDEDNNIRNADNLRKKDEFGEFDATKFEK